MGDKEKTEKKNGLPEINDPTFGDQHYVKMGEIILTEEPERYHLLGIGTCLGIYLYDLKKGIYTMAHTLLPSKDLDASNERHEKLPAKFTDYAIGQMIDSLLKKGARKADILAKVAGGAQIYNDSFNIGERNYLTAKKILEEQGIPLVAADVGGKTGRSIVRFLKSGELIMRKEGKQYTI